MNGPGSWVGRKIFPQIQERPQIYACYHCIIMVLVAGSATRFQFDVMKSLGNSSNAPRRAGCGTESKPKTSWSEV
jgi:hypothetical protein